MKKVVFIRKAKCRACEFNDYRRTGVDFCVRAGCRYKAAEAERKDKDNSGGRGGAHVGRI